MEKVDVLADQFLGEVERANANRQGHILAELTVLSFLIERQIATLEEVEQRIQLIRSVMPPDYQSDDVGVRVSFLTDVLRRVYGPKPHGWTPQVIEGGKDREKGDDPTETDLP